MNALAQYGPPFPPSVRRLTLQTQGAPVLGVEMDDWHEIVFNRWLSMAGQMALSGPAATT
jgi:hypothetical protein